MDGIAADVAATVAEAERRRRLKAAQAARDQAETARLLAELDEQRRTNDAREELREREAAAAAEKEKAEKEANKQVNGRAGGRVGGFNHHRNWI